MVRNLRPRRRDEQGAVAVMVALITTVMLFGIAALVVDLGLARDTKQQSQISADAASLAAANRLYPSNGACLANNPNGTAVPPCFTDAVAAAKSYSTINYRIATSAWDGCTDSGSYWVPTGSTPCISFTDAALGSTQPAQPLKVRVKMPQRDVTTGFGVVAGTTTIPINTAARATLKPGDTHSCGLCLLGSGVSPLGNGDVTITGGSVFSNGSVDSGPNGHMIAQPAGQTITMVGTCAQNCSPASVTAPYPITDPYATSLTLPLDMSGLTNKSNPCTDGPGRYAALTLDNSVCTLSPGLYVLTGTWDAKNNTQLKGTGITLYGTCGTQSVPAVCTSGQTGGSLDMSNGDAMFSAPGSSPVNKAVSPFAIIYDRQNVAGLTLQGNGNTNITGTVYAPKATLSFPGNSIFTVTNGPVIVASMYGNGNTGGMNLTSVNSVNNPDPPGNPSLDQ